ncbi:hypothetical protein [Enterococcus dongliensis]|uniref:hypothetical protein n=1 Tax=Enterococcus dongliensis TaxID=2559925 RepID=UPI00288C8BC1|nr:hypothetical protein [Enterococcus dongliensis]MDT2672617.1 hypothetical protein [Enterococcus dongliensis]MDT2712291.1 hypothetical protein [Enterococcus dongliensis]
MDYFSDEFLAYLELKQDMLFHKIPEENILYYIDESLNIGANFAAKKQSKDIFTLYQESDIQIKEEKHDGVFFKVQMRAQYESDRKGNHKVYLYEKSIAQLAKANQLGLKEMKKIILAHEFFHYLEEKSDDQVYDHFAPIESAKILGFSQKAHIRRTSEVAANAFAKCLLKLKHLPSYYDYHYLLSTKQLSTQEIEEEYAQFTSLKRMQINS